LWSFKATSLHLFLSCHKLGILFRKEKIDGHFHESFQKATTNRHPTKAEQLPASNSRDASSSKDASKTGKPTRLGKSATSRRSATLAIVGTQVTTGTPAVAKMTAK
jgi:hypothetical protein